jgi:uncharacterized protein YgbK (DUF1537 family)
LLIAAIADDLTGATDIALAFSRQGLRTFQINGVPDATMEVGGADAVVIALKSRTIKVEFAVAQSRAAAAWLTQRGAQQIIFKYCSTFDSTEEGNIGPVTEALLEHLGEETTIACPTFPENRRTVVHGHVFVGNQLLSESSMKDHPLTPMRDANIVRVLQRQTQLSVGLLPHCIVRQGAAAIRERVRCTSEEGRRILVADALYAEDLLALARAFQGCRLLTGASGIGDAAARLLAPQIPSPARRAPIVWPAGDAAILAGSCSVMTRAQVDHVLELGYPALKIDAEAILSEKITPADAAEWASARRPATPIIYSSTDPDEIAAVQARLGKERSGSIVEEFFGVTAQRLRATGFSRMMVAGGETSGAVVQGLGGRMLHIGPEIDPGVPWTKLLGTEETALALKSGNFGAKDFFPKALVLLS